MSDPYFKLKPLPPTPADECCSCAELNAAYLAHKLGDNPLYCLTCNGEVAPERIGFDERTTEAVARWNDVYRSIYRLWLDSGSYDAWAEAELLSKDSDVNRLGMLARQALAAYLPTSYLWFWEEERPTACPVCGSSDLSSRGGPRRLCEKCGVLL
ncbi:MAG TPA: hypothetical protein VJS12_20525 [Steroidobacteraceae bacterium]|nr:hypothetical protein [Steroidobacteraceae bacterium]